jgi:hypothetical protein
MGFRVGDPVAGGLPMLKRSVLIPTLVTIVYRNENPTRGGVFVTELL